MGSKIQTQSTGTWDSSATKLVSVLNDILPGYMHEDRLHTVDLQLLY